MASQDSLNTRRTLEIEGTEYDYYDLPAAARALDLPLERLPVSLRYLLENLLRHEDGETVEIADLRALGAWLDEGRSRREIAYRPARVLMQDFTGVPAIVDLAAMRDAFAGLGGDPARINPLSAVDLVIDHSIMVDAYGNPRAFDLNVEREFQRNGERYKFLRWGQEAFDNFRVVPPGTGICHQVNLEYLGKTVWTAPDPDRAGRRLAMPDTLVGTDSHTTMINGLAVLGWGVGGIEAEAAMLGQPISMVIPEVVGFKLTGELAEGATATDLVLTVTQMLRAHGVVGKFVEFHGDGLDHLSLADRATIGNMAPEYGATCGFFPIDDETLRYLRFTGRDAHQVALVEAYAKAQGLWRAPGAEPRYTTTLELDLGEVVPSIAGPKRPQDRVALSEAATQFDRDLGETFGVAESERATRTPVAGEAYDLGHGDIVIAAITSCTNTSNPSVMLAAGLLARKARARGLSVAPHVKTSLAPGSQVVTDYLEAAGLQADLDALGFNLVGYGCTTCIGNSGPLAEPVAEAIEAGTLVAASVLSGNRNFEGRINPHCRANYLASPPLVVAYALAGNMHVDIAREPLGQDSEGRDVHLADLWPSKAEIDALIDSAITPEMFTGRYGDVFEGPPQWKRLSVSGSTTYDWESDSTYVKNPPFFEGMTPDPAPARDISGARLLALLGDSVTTDHISPAGAIKADSPAGRYLTERGIAPRDFNSYGARRGNHEIMMRGTFANIRIRNELVPGTEGGVTRHVPSGEELPIYDAAMRYVEEDVPLLVIAGKEYGTGSSRDWAAKGTRLLGVRAVLAESYERIHRANLIGMGVLPLQFKPGQGRADLGLTGEESFDVMGIEAGLAPGAELMLTCHRADGGRDEIPVDVRLDTANEVTYYRHGGILHYVLRRMLEQHGGARRAG